MKDSKVLGPAGEKIVFGLTEVRNPSDVKTGNGLYVWSSFKDRIISKAETVEAGKEFSITFQDILVRATDEEIEADLSKNHVFSESDVCAVILELISKQSQGSEGKLLNNGYANLFYTPSFVVHVFWSSVGGEWGVSAWPRDDDGWGAGSRVFSPATGL